MKHIRLFIAAVALSLGVVGMSPIATFADTPQTSACQALGSSDCSSNPSEGVDLNKIITAVINILSVIVGIVAVIMIIVGGFRYITSNGDSNGVSGAKNTIIYAVVGLVIVASAQAIVKFVLNRIN